MFKANPVKQKFDEYYTRKKTFEDITLFIPNNKIIYEPFYGVGQSVTYLKELGYEIRYKDADFFTDEILQPEEYDIIITNPPFTLKKETLKRLREINKPFILILPMTVIFTKYFHEIFGADSKDLQFIIPNNKIHFDCEYILKDNTSFYSFYLCYKMNFENSVNLIKI